MQVYDESIRRSARARVRLNWSRELVFSPRQVRFIKAAIPDGRGVYAVYAKDDLFPYAVRCSSRLCWTSRIYLGSGWIGERLCRHLSRRENNVLSDYIDYCPLVFRYAFITDEQEDWPRVTEASLLHLFKKQFGDLPPANRRREPLPELGLNLLHIDESENFRFVGRGQ